MEIPTKLRSILAGFRYCLLALILLVSSSSLISCGGGETTYRITELGGEADKLVINAPANVETGSESTISVLATANDQAVSGQAITFRITFNDSGSKLDVLNDNGTKQQDGSIIVETVDGIASVTYTAGGFNIPATDTITISTANLADEERDIGVVPPGVGSVDVSTTRDTLPAISANDGSNRATIVAEVKDTGGTPLELIDITFTTTAGNLCAVGTGNDPGLCDDDIQIVAQTDGFGIARVTLQSSTTLGPATVQAQTPDLTSGTTVVTFISGPAANFILTANPSNLTADGVSKSEVTTLVLDSAGHLVADGTSVTFSVKGSSTGEGTISPLPVATFFGLASQTFTAGGTLTADGDIDILATAGTADSGDVGNGLITLITEFINSVSLSLDSTTLIADGTDITGVTALVKNTGGLPVNPGTSVTFTTTGGQLDTVIPFVPPVETSITVETVGDTGEAFVLLQSDIFAGQYFVKATSGSKNDVATVNFIAGPAYDDGVNTRLEVSPGTIPANGTSTATLTLFAYDENDNPVADDKTVLFAADDPDAVISNATTTSGGIATATVTSSTTVGTVELSAAIDGITLTTDIDFDAAPETNPNTIQLALSGGTNGNGTYIAIESPGGSTAIEIEATVLDGTGNPIGFDCPGNIEFEIVTGPADAELDNSLVPVEKTTADGVASVFLTAGITPGTVRVQVTATQDTGDCASVAPPSVSALTTPIVIGAGEATFLYLFPESELVDIPNSSLTGQIFNAMVTDAFGNTVEDGTAVYFSLVGSAGGDQVCPEGYTGLATTSDDCSGVTTAISGVARTLLTWAPELIWTDFTLSAETAGGTPTDTYNGNYPAKADVTITVDITPNTVAAGTDGVAVVATLEDGSTPPNPIADITIDFSSDSAAAAVVTPSDDTNAIGRAFTTLNTTDCLAADVTVEITASAAPYSGKSDPDLKVTATAPTAAFSNTNIGTVFTFTNTSSEPAGYNYTYAWDFGDTAGGTSPDENPVYDFTGAESGNDLTVELTVTNTNPPGGGTCTGTFSKVITVP